MQERDIQCALHAKLRNEINQQVNVVGVNQPTYKLNLINSEYLNSIDLVCLDPSGIENLSIENAKKKQEHGQDWYIYHLPVLLGIELKYIWMGQTRGVKIFTDDVKKLKESTGVANWLSICFIQDKLTEEKHLLKLSKHQTYKPVQRISDCNNQYIVGFKNTYLVNLNV